MYNKQKGFRVKIAIASKSNAWTTNLLDGLKNKNPLICFNFIDENLLDSCSLEDQAKKYAPDKIIFFHWSTYIAENFIQAYDCYTIHTSNLPDGRGGHPLQNQMLEGIFFTKVNLIKTSKKLDYGDIYGSKQISLGGSLQDIWTTISEASIELVHQLINNPTTPQKQEVGGKIYKRLEDKSIPFDTQEDIFKIYRFIQSKDAENYLPAKIKIGNYVLEFSRASFKNNKITCDVRICHE